MFFEQSSKSQKCSRECSGERIYTNTSKIEETVQNTHAPTHTYLHARTLSLRINLLKFLRTCRRFARSISLSRVRSLARRPRSLYRAGVGDSVDGSSTYYDAIALARKEEEARRVGAHSHCSLASSRAAPTAAAAVATAQVAKCALSLSFTSVDVTTLPRRKKHLASREARIHAAVTQLSRGPPCPTSSGVHCHVPLSPPLLPALPQLYLLPSPDCSLRSCSLRERSGVFRPSLLPSV